jgi:hypothetical protein
LTHFANAELALSFLLPLGLLIPLPAVNAGDGNGVLIGVGRNLPDWAEADLEDFTVPLSRSVEKGAEARERERERMEVEGVTFETKEWSEEARRGKMSRAITFTEGAQATTMARWFSITDQIIALAKRPVNYVSRGFGVEDTAAEFGQEREWICEE